MPPLLERLKERKLVQWSLAYLAGAYLVYEASWTAAEAWGISVTLVRGTHVLLVFGLLVTVVLAWYHGEKGHQRFGGAELLMLSLLLVGAGGVLSKLAPEQQQSSPRTAAPPVDEEDRPSIAVLPFDNFSRDTENEFFAGGMHEQIISTLSTISALRVVSRTSVMQYGEGQKAVPQIAVELGVDFILEGSARLAGDQVRLTVQLIDAGRDEHIWVEDYDRDLSAADLFSVQGEVARKVAFSVGITLTPEEQEAVGSVLTDNTDAYLYFIQGNEEYLSERQGTTGTNFRSIGLYERAVELDPAFAPAHARLALTLAYTNPDDEPYERARQEAELALASLPRLAEARIALGRYALVQGDSEEALRQFRAASLGNPNQVLSALELGDLQRRLGEFDSAIQTFENAESVDPLNTEIHRALTQSYLFAHRYDRALRTNADRAAAYPSWATDYIPLWVHLVRGERSAFRSTHSQYLEDWGQDYSMDIGLVFKATFRLLTPKQHRTSFQGYMSDRQDEPCVRLGGPCFVRANHEEGIGSADRARVYWDSLAVVAEENPPQTWWEHAAAALVFQSLGRKEEAIEAAEALVALNGGEGEGVVENRYYLGPMGRIHLASVLTHFGELDAAIDLLEELLPAPSWLTVHILEIDPIWDPLRDHPGFQALLEKYADDVEH